MSYGNGDKNPCGGSSASNAKQSNFYIGQQVTLEHQDAGAVKCVGSSFVSVRQSNKHTGRIYINSLSDPSKANNTPYNDGLKGFYFVRMSPSTSPRFPNGTRFTVVSADAVYSYVRVDSLPASEPESPYREVKGGSIFIEGVGTLQVRGGANLKGRSVYLPGTGSSWKLVQDSEGKTVLVSVK